MKKKIALLLCAAMLLSLMLPMVSAYAVLGPQWVWSSNGKPVKLRSAPTQDGQVLTKIEYGTRLTNCSYYNETWTKVTYKGMTGYMMTKFLMSQEPPYHPVYPTATPKPTAKPTAKPVVTNMFSKMKKTDYYVVVNPSNGASFGNMRWAPSEDQPVIRIYYPGYQLRVLYTDGTWCQVLDEATGTCGFMKSFLLQEMYVGMQ